MALVRQSHKTEYKARRAKRQTSPRVSHEEKLRFIHRHYPTVDPDNKRTVARKYSILKRAPLQLLKPASKSKLAELKKRGFFVTAKGAIVDGPRDSHGQRIKGSQTRINKDGTVVTSFKQRRDYVVGFTAKEKKEFARNPEAFRKKKLAELKKRYPKLKKAKNIRMRLQWGAYAATKDFSPNYFSKDYFQKVDRHDKKKLEPLTGFHFIVHFAKSRKKGKRKGKRRR